MSVWLIETGEYWAHQYPDDDSITVASCGHKLLDDCEHCGRTVDVIEAPKHAKKCPKCEVAS